MEHDYLRPEPWVADFRRFLAEHSRDRGNPEHATIHRDEATAAGFCNDDTDWLILTNRIAVDRAVHVLDEFSVLHARRDAKVRNALTELWQNGPVSLRQISEITDTALEDVRAVVENVLDGPTRQATDWNWKSDDLISIPRMSFDVIGPGPAPVYPSAPLEGLYRRRKGDALGAGGTATVATHALVRDTTFAARGTDVAVKLIREDALSRLNGDGEIGRRRLLREFQIGRFHKSDRLVRTLDVFSTKLVDPYRGGEVTAYGLVMEQVNGFSLARLGDDELLVRRFRLAVEMARAVSELHALGYVHRDVKPDNALANATGNVVLVDYGLTKSEDDSTFTRPGDHAYTWAYASPEQMDDASSESPSMDIYALGLSLYEVLTGRTAWHWIPVWKRDLAKREGPMRPPGAELPQGVLDLIVRMTDPSPDLRPSAAEVVAELERLEGI